MENNNIWEQKDKRISYQSLFSTLATLYQNGTYDYKQLSQMAYELNEDLHKRYPTPEEIPLENKAKPVEQRCSKCGKEMKKKKGKFGDFYGCTGYPDCKNIVNIKEDINDVDERAYGS